MLGKGAIAPFLESKLNAALDGEMEAIKIRNRIEGKNSDLKNRHGMRTTISFGLDSFEIQAAVALYYVNLKRIMKLKAK